MSTARLYGSGAQEVTHLLTGPSDEDSLRAAHRFLRSEEDENDTSWESRLAAKYYARLFKEYAIADLSRWKDKQLGLRWRTEREVVSGKGQFMCGAKGCDATAGLASFEVPFSYTEAGERKQALVKLRVCAACAEKLNHGRSGAEQHKRAAREKESQGQKRKRVKQEETDVVEDMLP